MRNTVKQSLNKPIDLNALKALVEKTSLNAETTLSAKFSRQIDALDLAVTREMIEMSAHKAEMKLANNFTDQLKAISAETNKIVRDSQETMLQSSRQERQVARQLATLGIFATPKQIQTAAQPVLEQASQAAPSAQKPQKQSMLFKNNNSTSNKAAVLAEIAKDTNSFESTLG